MTSALLIPLNSSAILTPLISNAINMYLNSITIISPLNSSASVTHLISSAIIFIRAILKLILSQAAKLLAPLPHIGHENYRTF